MSGLLAITARELRLRWTLLPVALSLGLVPLLAPVLAPVLGFALPAPGLVGLVLSLLMGTLAALLTGASVIGGDLGSRRLGFFFSRPLAWWAIWGGKFLAAVLLTLGAGLLAAVPWLAWGLAGPLRLASLWDLQGAVVALGWVLLLVGAGHAASVAYRSRSAWLLVDLGLLASLVLLIRSLGDLILLAGIAMDPGHARFALQYLLLSPSLALVAASAAQVAKGRTDVRRGHLALSVSLWAMLFLGVGSLLGFGVWVKSAKPSDLRRVTLSEVAPRGDWISVAGWARGRGRYWPAFLYDAANARYVRLQRPGIPLAFSPRGERVALLDFVFPPGRHAGADLTLVDLADGTPRTSSFGRALVPSAGLVQDVAFGPAGDRLAVVWRQALSVYELSSGRLLGSASAGSGRWLPDVVFLDDRRLRGLRRIGGEDTMVQIVEIRLPGGHSEITGQVATTAAWTRSDDAGDRLFVIHRTTRPLVTLHDGHSGSLLATLTGPGTDRGADAGFLSGGRIAVVSGEGGHSLLRVCRRDGTEERRLQLGPGWCLLGGEPEPGRLYVGLRSAPSKSRTVLIDLDRGSILRSEGGLFPAAAAHRRDPRYPPPRPRPGTPGAALFVSDDGELIRLDPTTGQRTVLLGGEGKP